MPFTRDSKQEKVVMVDRNIVSTAPDKNTIEALCTVAKKITLVREECRKLLENNKISEDEYNKIRDYVGDCYHVMGLLCDCAPIKLIAGNVDGIIDNLNA